MSAHEVRPETTSLGFCAPGSQPSTESGPPMCVQTDEQGRGLPFTETPIVHQEYQAGPGGIVQGVDPQGNPFTHYAD